MSNKDEILKAEKEVIEDSKKNIKPDKKFSLNEKTLKELEAVANLIKDKKAKNIIILTGAGISTSSGIPDFRSPKTGLYHNLKKYNLPLAEDIFCIEYFEENPIPFFQLVKELYPGKFFPSLSHFFIRLVQEKGLLIRNFTQNIDGLERLAGLNPDYLIESHGAFHTSSCIKCKDKVDTDKVKNLIFNDKIPKCRKCDGLVKPDIVFFGESMPIEFFKSIKTDFPKCDLILIMGTSLKVQPFASLIDEVDHNVPKLLINLENSFDFPSPFLSLKQKTRKSNLNKHFCESNCDDGVYALCELLGWREELMKMYKNHIDMMELFEFKEDEESNKYEDDDKLAEAMEKLKVAD